MSDTPTSPTTAPVIPVGLATAVGYAFGVINAVAAAVLLALEGLPDNAPTAIVIVTLLGAAAGAIVRVNDGRQAQAAAAIHGAVIAANTLPEPELTDDDLAGRDDGFEEVGHGNDDMSGGDSHLRDAGAQS